MTRILWEIACPGRYHFGSYKIDFSKANWSADCCSSLALIVQRRLAFHALADFAFTVVFHRQHSADVIHDGWEGRLARQNGYRLSWRR